LDLPVAAAASAMAGVYAAHTGSPDLMA
jgi:hypothetical protein